MLKAIVQQSSELVAFIKALNIVLYQSQIRHLMQLLDALLVCNDKKTLTNLYHQHLHDPDPKTAADFFRESPWQKEAVSKPRKLFMLMKFLEIASRLGLEKVILVSIDDSLGKKDRATRHLEAVDYHHNHSSGSRKKPAFANGYVYVEVHIQIGPLGFLFDTRLYLREKKVRQLNRERKSGEHLHYRSKYALAREMLVELSKLLPKGYQVYVLFDSWYASARLIKFCWRQRWHVICALKSNRRIDKKRIDHHNQTLKHKRYQTVKLNAADPSRKARTYWVRSVRGHLEDVAGEVCAIISKKHPGDQRPKYFVCTNLSLSVQQALNYYQKRWSVEVGNFYLKEALGLGDFRLQSYEAIQKWFEIVVLALNYLQYRAARLYEQTHSLYTSHLKFICQRISGG
ncbi:MAG: transposase [Anaerolineales bacterium]